MCTMTPGGRCGQTYANTITIDGLVMNHKGRLFWVIAIELYRQIYQAACLPPALSVNLHLP